MLKICHPREGGDPGWQQHCTISIMDSRLRGKDNIIFVIYKAIVYRIDVKVND